MSTSSMTTSESTEVTGEDHIKVCVRIRPVVRSERDLGEILSWNWENNQITQLDKQPIKNMPNYQANTLNSRPSYNFDHLFYPENTNRDIFDSVVKTVVMSVMNGFHGSVFTYGQTSSGKTFTMTGNPQQPGIIPQAINCCFDSIHSYTDREFLVRVSYLEIYNEQVKDLLNSEVVAIKIQHDPKNGTVITGVKEQVVVNSEQTISYIRAGEAHRHVGATDMNEKSSRAHTLFKLTIESRERQGNSSSGSPVRVSTLNLVDLAGSENAKQTNSKGERALEARYINQSLLTLSTIIHKLSEEKPGMTPLARRQHLPYRDSKLTRILQPSLDGNAHIAVICTISPVLSCVDETNNTLKFASRAKSVKMNAKVNDVMDEKTLLKVYREEIEQLKKKLEKLEKQSEAYHSAGPNRLAPTGSFEEEDDEKDMLLQMITEMESMILKADTKKFMQPVPEESNVFSSPAGNSKIKPLLPPASNTSKQAQSSTDGVALTQSTDESPKDRLSLNRQVSKSSITDNSKQTPGRAKTGTTVKQNEKPRASSPAPLTKGLSQKNAAAASTAGGREANKPRFGFGFGFKGKDQPNASPETKQSKQRESIAEKILQDDVDAEDARSVSSVDRTEAMPPRNSGLDRQSSVVLSSFHGEEVGDKVLFGVSKMLSALKMHIGKSRGNGVRKGSNDTDSSTSPTQPMSQITDLSIQAKIERLELDLRLKDADNRFLQEELEKKDKMLNMVTEGLREVESSQQQWVSTNQELSDDLEKALMNTAWLAQELARLQNLLAQAGIDASSYPSNQGDLTPTRTHAEEY